MKSKNNYDFSLESLNKLKEISHSLQVNNILLPEETFHLHKLIDEICPKWGREFSSKDTIEALDLIFDTQILGKDRDKIYTQIAESFINRPDKGGKKLISIDDTIDWMSIWYCYTKDIQYYALGLPISFYVLIPTKIL
ncbi:MAG: hypothetical protein LN588_05470 [Rickettsia endosymbiont of Bryobia graminum]|nr:hypothetical protein [Rickettsia endosymbiont of Bryobia graminum]